MTFFSFFGISHSVFNFYTNCICFTARHKTVPFSTFSLFFEMHIPPLKINTIFVIFCIACYYRRHIFHNFFVMFALFGININYSYFIEYFFSFFLIYSCTRYTSSVFIIIIIIITKALRSHEKIFVLYQSIDRSVTHQQSLRYSASFELQHEY